MKNLKIGDLVTQYGKVDLYRGDLHRIHVVTLVSGDYFCVDNQHYKIDRCDPKYWMKVKLEGIME